MRKYLILGAFAFIGMLGMALNGGTIVSPSTAAEITANVTSTPATAGDAQFRFQGLGARDAGMGVSTTGVPILKSATATTNITAAGALSVATLDTRLNTSSSTDVAVTLAAGEEGQDKFIVLETKGSTGNFVLTPTAVWGYTTITFNTVGDAVHLRFINGKWAIIANQGCTLA